MKFLSITFVVLVFLFAISLYASLKTVTSSDQIGVKNGSKGLAIGLGVLILLYLLMLASATQGYTGRCYQLFWYDDVGTPCSRYEHFVQNAVFEIGFSLSIGWPFIVIFLGICVLVAYLGPKFPKAKEN